MVGIFLISPAQLCHSISKHYNKNYGAALAIWDWIFGSLHHSEETENLTLGLGISRIIRNILSKSYIQFLYLKV